tara:strand:- start:2056 stop:3219 length:1164 start_codon:yes stop_codon:yes gene_type:complete
MSDSRKILINESFLSSSSASKKSRKGGKVKTRKEKPKSVIKPNSLKKTLLEKIKKHQQHEKITKDEYSRDKSDDSTKKDNQFHDNFMNSLEYLNKLNEKNKTDKKNRTKRNKSMKNGAVVGGSNNKPVPMIQNPVGPLGPLEPLVLVDLPMDFDSRHTVPQPYVNNNGNFGETIIHTSSMNENPMYGGNHIPVPYPITPVQMQPIPPVHSVQPIQPIHQVQPRPITPDTPYGCLKGGKKPTYRAYHNKTLKNKPLTIETSNRHNNNNNNNNNTERKQKLAELQKSYKKIRQKKRTTRKSTFVLGKVGGKVSVLIKNNATRRKVKREHGLLRQKSIIEIKKHLYDKNLLKIGSTAPNDVLRTLYEQSILAGDVTNTANDVQIHNFMNK